MLTDIEIARGAEMKKITDVASALGVEPDELELYGNYKAKLSDLLIKKLEEKKSGKLVLVTAVNPTPAGEGKTTVTIGLGDSMNRIGKKNGYRAKGAFARSCVRNQRRRCRRRLQPGRSDGRYQPAFYRGYACDYKRK